MNLFGRKARTICMCNVIVPFVCTGFLGVKSNNGILIGSTTNEAHEISLTSSDTEPVSQYWEGDNKFAFVTDGIEAIMDHQDFTGPQKIQGEENDFAFITESIKAVINQRESALAKVDTKSTKKSTTKNTTTKKTTKNTSKSTTTSVVTKKEVASTTTYEKPSNTSKTGATIASYAVKFKGLRYKTGTPSLKSGADCSGFTMLIYKEFGVSLPRTVGGQLGRGKAVSKDNLQKGDLVFFKKKGCRNCGASHVSIYIGGGQVVHETRPGRGVAITGIDGLSNIQFYAARRIINSSTAKVTETKKETKTDNTINVTPTPTPTPIINNVEKNENVNNNVVSNEVVTATPTPTVPTVEEKQEVKADTPIVENKTEETPKTEVKVETTTTTEVQKEVKEESTSEVSETPVSNIESN